MRSALSVQKMPPIEHWMPPSAAVNNAPVGGLQAAYAHATAHLRCSLPYHMPNDCLIPLGCAPVLAHSRVLGAQFDQSAIGHPRMHEYYTGTLGGNMCTGPTQRYVPRFTGVRGVERPAKHPWLQPQIVGGLALRCRRAHATAPTAGRSEAPGRKDQELPLPERLQ